MRVGALACFRSLLCVLVNMSLAGARMVASLFSAFGMCGSNKGEMLVGISLLRT